MKKLLTFDLRPSSSIFREDELAYAKWPTFSSNDRYLVCPNAYFADGSMIRLSLAIRENGESMIHSRGISRSVIL